MQSVFIVLPKWRRWYGALWVTLLIFCAAHAHALDPQLAFSQYCRQDWSVGAVLPYNDLAIYAVAQTPDGYVWLAGRKGLLRFDGVRFTVFDSKLIPQIRSDTNTVLHVSADGTLWIGTLGGGLLRVRQNEFTGFTSADGLLHDDVLSIAESPAGTLWVGTPEGLNCVTADRVRAVTVEGLPPRTGVSALCKGKGGSAWLGMSDGAVIHLEDDRATTIIPAGRGAARPAISGLLEARDGTLWIGSEQGQVTRFRNGKPTILLKGNNASLELTSFIEDRAGVIWISSWTRGILRWRDGDFCQQQPPPGFFQEQGFAITEDADGGIWLAGNSGKLTRLQEGPIVTFTTAEGLGGDDVRTILAARDGGLWIGTQNGLDQFRNGLLYPVPAVSQLSNEFVLSLAEDRDRTLWIGTRSRGLMRLKNDQLTSFAQQGKLDCEDIRALLVSRNGSLWIGSRRTGLGLFENGRLTMFTRADGLAGEEVRMIYEGADGSLWLALQDAGLGRFKDGKFTNYTQADGLPNLRVRAIYEDAEKTLWIGMNQGGLSRFKNGKFFNYSLAQGLFNEAIFFIHQDPQSRFWMSSSRGIFSVSRTNLNEVADGNLKKLFCHSYGVEEGMKELECNGGVQPAGAITPGGEFWLPTKLGAACLRLKKIPLALLAPKARIEHVAVNERLVGSGIVVPASAERRQLEFHYTALAFDQPRNVRFRYQLVGVNSDWVNSENQRIARYSDVRPGTYTFRVQAGTVNGEWESEGVALAIQLAARFTETNWFYALVGSLGAAVVIGFVVMRERFVRRVHALQKQHVLDVERARIAQDMHDDLGTNLTQIAFLSDRAAGQVEPPEPLSTQLRRIAATAQASLRSLNEIIWAVNPQCDTLENLVNFFSKFAQDYCRLAGIQFRLDLPVVIPTHPLSSEDRHNLLLALKETLNNTVRHAVAAEVRFRFCFTPDEFIFSVQDNGGGFDTDLKSESGNGLNNIRKRVEQVSGTLEIASAHGQGTNVMIRLPCSRNTKRASANTRCSEAKPNA